MPKFDAFNIKKDFPILSRKLDGKDLVYLDNAATSQKPQQVIDAIVNYYSLHNANVHRGLHTLSEEATDLYEEARKKVAEFINALGTEEVIFTKGATESLNFAAQVFGDAFIQKGDKILLTTSEHHSNLIPWQKLAERTGAELLFIDTDDNGIIDFAKFERYVTPEVKIVAISHASNVLGTIFPVREIADAAHKAGAYVVVDGAQAIPHLSVNVQHLGCDAYAFSGHKMLGPTGIGVLWVKKDVIKKLEPYQFGGGMIDEVQLKRATWQEGVERFEAGTPNIAGAIGLGAAIDYLNTIGMDAIREHEIELNKYAIAELSKIEGVKIYGPQDAEARTGLVSFSVKGLHAHDVAAVLNTQGVAVRSGQHCTMPLHTRLGTTATTRASYYLYNTPEDIDALVAGVAKAIKILS